MPAKSKETPVPQASAVHLSSRSHDLPSIILVFISTLLCAAVVFQGWRTLNQPAASDVPTPSNASASPVTDTRLRLNQSHTRQGAAITADPSQIGRANPFGQP